MNIAVIGAGHAGVEAARVAAEAGSRVTLYSAESVLPYYRPRLVALAFGQAEESSIYMHPESWYREHGIELLLSTPVDAVNGVTGAVHAGASPRVFHAVILAMGSGPVLPPFAAACPWCVFPLWTVEHARAIRTRIQKDGRLIVIGGGILGLETALRAQDAGLQVTIIERQKRLMPRQFGERGSGMIYRLIRNMGIDVRLGQTVTRLEAGADESGLTMHLEESAPLQADLCVVSVGALPELALARRSALDLGHGVKVDETLHTSAPVVWAAGDIVEHAGWLQCSARGAALQGHLASLNALAVLGGETPQPYANPHVPVTLKMRGVELHSTGSVAADEHEELPLDGNDDSALRALVVREGLTVGVQMVGTRKGFDQYASGLGQKPAAPLP